MRFGDFLGPVLLLLLLYTDDLIEKHGFLISLVPLVEHIHHYSF